MGDQREIILQAHDQLHKGEIGTAHELLHKALGQDNDAALPTKPLAHRSGFDHAFRTACRKNGVRAMFILIDEHDPSGKARLLSGGDAQLCGEVDKLLRGTGAVA